MWEYKVAMIDEDNLSGSFMQGYLDTWGHQGWELTEVMSNRPNTSKIFIFKRRSDWDKPEESKADVLEYMMRESMR